MVDASIVTNPPKALMSITYMDLIIESMKYYVQTAMLTTMIMMKYLITVHMIRVAKIVVRLVHGIKLIINGSLLIQMGRFTFANI